MDFPDPPEGWGLKSLIELNEGSWSAHLWGPEEYVYGYGTTARFAMLNALNKIEEGLTFERLSGGQPTTIDLVKALGLRAKPLVRRF